MSNGRDDTEHWYHSDLRDKSPLQCEVDRVWESKKGNLIAKLIVSGREVIHTVENERTQASLEQASEFGGKVILDATGGRGDAEISWSPSGGGDPRTAPPPDKGTGPGKPGGNGGPDPFDPSEPSPDRLNQGQQLLNALNLAADVMSEFQKAHGRLPTEEERRLATTLIINGEKDW